MFSAPQGIAWKCRSFPSAAPSWSCVVTHPLSYPYSIQGHPSCAHSCYTVSWLLVERLENWVNGRGFRCFGLPISTHELASVSTILSFTVAPGRLCPCQSLRAAANRRRRRCPSISSSRRKEQSPSPLCGTRKSSSVRPPQASNGTGGRRRAAKLCPAALPGAITGRGFFELGRNSSWLP